MLGKSNNINVAHNHIADIDLRIDFQKPPNVVALAVADSQAAHGICDFDRIARSLKVEMLKNDVSGPRRQNEKIAPMIPLRRVRYSPVRFRECPGGTIRVEKGIAVLPVTS